MFANKRILVVILIVVALLILVTFQSKAKEPINETEPGTNFMINNTFNGIPGTKNFHLSEFHSKDGMHVPETYYGNLQKLMINLQVLRDSLGVAITVNSGYRSPAHNAAIGGKPGSMHLQAAAADIVATGYTAAQVQERIVKLIASGQMQNGGLGSYSSFTHYDVGPVRRWT